MSRIEQVGDVAAGVAMPPAPPPFPSRLRPPRTSLDLVVREAVLSALTTSVVPLVLVSAPAGWGKTTVLQQWADRERRLHAWLQLEDAHNDPLVLLTSLAAALSGVAQIDPMVAQWARLAAPPVRERILPSLEGSVAQAAPFLVVLDDAQFLTNKSGWEIIAFLLRALPGGAQLALGTRTEPPLPLARLQAAGQLLQLSTAELALDLLETGDLLRMRGLEADAATTAALRAATEGWAAGISLAALACDEECTPDWLAAVRGDRRDIARYLTSEVLERQTRSDRAFLLQTSILSRLSSGPCRAVTAREDAGAVLARLARDNVFVASLDDEGESYRYHQLFAELLRSELERRDGARLPELHRSAAAWYEGHGQTEEAVRHWLAAGEVDKAALIVCRAYTLYSGQGQVETVRRWLELFSDDQLLSSVPLTLTAGWIASMTGDTRAGRLWAGAALSERVDDSLMPDGAVTQRASQAALRAGVGAGGVRQMRQDAELAAALIADSHPAWRAGTDTILGVARWLSGDCVAAEAAFASAIAEGSPFNVIAEIGALGYLSILMGDEGRWSEAEGHAERARRRFTEAELGFSGPMIVVPLAEARVLAHGGTAEIDGQVEVVEDAVHRLSLPPWLSLVATVILAEMALERGDIEAVQRGITSGLRILRSWPDAGILGARLEHLRQALEERRLAGHLTPAERHVLELLATHLTSLEIARRLGVSPNTMKSHVRDIFRKLDAHSRSEAVERARAVGLLAR